MAYKYGISGPFWCGLLHLYPVLLDIHATSSMWSPFCAVAMLANLSMRTGSMCMTLPCRYAAGATIQILLFGILAIEIKRKAPTAHTMLEIIRARWGTLAHIVRKAPMSAFSQTIMMRAMPCLPLYAVF